MSDTADRASHRVRYVCMPGSPYTGSTLLGFLLNDHPQLASVGAATGLTSRVDLATYLCSCGLPFRGCPFWMAMEQRTSELGHPVTVFRTGFWNTHVRVSRRRWLNGLLVGSLGNELLTAMRDEVIGRRGPLRRVRSEARGATWALGRAVLERTGASVFIDTARDHQRPRLLAEDPAFDLKVIHLVRDPRGNVASIMKHTGVDVRSAARQWRHYNVEAARVERSVPRGSWLRVRYEELCADPQATLDRVARFVGVEPVALPPVVPSAEHHIIGNSMRLSSVGEIREDRSWRDVLTDDDLAAIAAITRTTSRALGIGWPPREAELVRAP